MSQTKYTVVATPVVGHPVREQQVAGGAQDAIKLAKKWGQEFAGSECGVYIEFFYPATLNRGYINPDGAGVSGKDWAAVQ